MVLTESWDDVRRDSNSYPTGIARIGLGRTSMYCKRKHVNMIFPQKVKLLVKFIFSEKATKFCEISTVDLTVTIHIG